MDYIPYLLINDVEVSGEKKFISYFKQITKIRNGLPIFFGITKDSHKNYTNLPDYLLNGIGTQNMNCGPINVTINKHITAYVLRFKEYLPGEENGWTLYGKGHYIRAACEFKIYKKELEIGLYRFGTHDSLYIFTSQLPISYQKHLSTSYDKHLENGIMNIYDKYKKLEKENAELKERLNDIEEKLKILLSPSKFM